MDKQNVAYIYKGILLRLKKEENPVTYSNMDEPEDRMLNEISQSQNGNYYMIPLI
jgi:hypothetical protein